MPKGPCFGLKVTAKDFARFSAKVWNPRHWDRLPKGETIDAQRHKLRCARGPGHRKAMKLKWQKDQRKFLKRRGFEREIREVAPYECGGGVRSAIPCYIPECESEYDFTAVNPSSGAGGFYQFLPSTWRALGGKGAPHEAPPMEQHRLAGILYASEGPGQWVCAG